MFVCSVCAVDVFKRQIFSLVLCYSGLYKPNSLQVWLMWERCFSLVGAQASWAPGRPGCKVSLIDVCVPAFCCPMVCSTAPQGLSTPGRISPGPHLYWGRYVAFNLGWPCCGQSTGEENVPEVARWKLSLFSETACSLKFTMKIFLHLIHVKSTCSNVNFKQMSSLFMVKLVFRAVSLYSVKLNWFLIGFKVLFLCLPWTEITHCSTQFWCLAPLV